MRLIDADLLTEKVTKWLNSDPNADRMVDIDDIAVSVLMEIEEQPTVPLWIPADERTPEVSSTYIVCCKEQDLKHVTFAKFYKKLGYWELKGSRTFWKVTHWMPLPEPPEEEK